MTSRIFMQQVCPRGLAGFERTRVSNRPRSWRSPIPCKPGVYAIYLYDDLLYVGMSSSIADRVRQHWFPRTHVAWFECEEGIARQVERFLIGEHNPPGNVALRTNAGLTGRALGVARTKCGGA